MTYYVATREILTKKHYKPVRIVGSQAAHAQKEFATMFDTYEEATSAAFKLGVAYMTHEFKVKEVK